MKVRIKIIEKNNGTKIFIPQAKDGLSIFGFIVNIFTLIFFGKRWYKYYGLTKIAESRLNNLLGIKTGDIIHCSEEEAARFLDYDSAMAFLQEYIKQENLAIYLNREDALKAKMVEEVEEARLKGEKTKKVKFVKVRGFNIKLM
jgi:hypothetical protein